MKKNFSIIALLTMVLLTVASSFSFAETVTTYSLTDGIGTAEVTTADATVNAGTSLVLTNSAGRIKITPATGYKFQNGDVISFSGKVGNESKNYGLKIYASNGSTLITSNNVAGSEAANGCTITLSLSSDQDYIYIARYDGTTTTMTSFTVTREASAEELGTRYTVSFNANGNGTCYTSYLTEASEGVGVTLPTATANYGYNFLGWSTSSTATTASYSAGATYKPSANTTLYAIYEVDANAPVLPAAGSAITFDATKRYSEWVINSRINDFKGNKTATGFGKFDDNGNIVEAPANSKDDLDYVPGLVAKAILEAVDYYKDNNDINVKPWYYAMQYYGNHYDITSNGKNGKSFDDLNAVKLYFELQKLAASGSFADGAEYTNATTVTTANTRFASALSGINKANTSYSISADLLPGAAGGWFHKSDYTDQMWCDGQYMGPALLAQMINEYSNYSNISDNDWDLVTKQFTISWNYLWNPEVKLLYHAFTADPAQTHSTKAKDWYGISGTPGSEIYHSAEYWGRAEGWYFLALVDVLEQMQIAGLTKTQNYKTLHGYLNELAAGIAAKQDAATGCWYQLLNHDGTFYANEYNGKSYTDTYNYLESSATAIFTAAYLKGMRLGLYDTDYTAIAKKAYQGIVEQFMVADGNGGVHLIGCCKSAGVGGSSFRDGSAAYYLLGSDVPKTTTSGSDFYTEGKVFGGFILAATEYERRFIDKKLELSENGSYTEFPVGEYDEVTLSRSFPSNQWTTMTVPFSISDEQVQTAFGNGTELAAINKIDNDKLYFTKKTDITANEPVLIKVATVNENGNYTFNNVTVENSTSLTQVGKGAQLNGNYTLLTGGQNGDLGAEEYFIANNLFYDCTYLGNMKPFRAYITTAQGAGAKLSFSFLDEQEETAINIIKAEGSDDNAPAYNIAGQRVSNNARGMLIQNGHKTLH